MKRNIRKAYGLAGVVALGAAASAREPAAELLPVRVVEPTANVVRGATPYAPFTAIPQAPADSVPAAKYASTTTTNAERSWASRQWNSATDIVVGKGEGKPYVPFSSLDGKPQTPPPGAMTPGKVNPGVQPVGLATAPQQPQAPQGVYAGPPAYRWYGWGSTTPGANPHSPTGVYPKASANWYSQTGATPGAFPIPVTYPRRENGAEPPVYVGGPNPANVEPAGRTVIAELPRSAPPMPRYEAPIPASVPEVPSGAPMPIAMNTTTPVIPTRPAAVEPAPSLPAPAPAPVAAVANELNWQAAAKQIAEPIPANVPAPPPPPMFAPAVTPVPPPSMPSILPPPPVLPMPAKEFVAPASPAPLAPSAPIIAPVIEEEQAWGKPKMSRDSGIVPASANSVARGQQPHDAGATLEASIRNACPTPVRKVDINRIGGNGLVVRFTVDCEAHAQDAATAIAGLPELKAFDVRYEALLLAK